MSDHPARPVLGRIFVGTLLCLLIPATVSAATLNVGGTGAALGAMQALAQAFQKARPDVSVQVPDSLGSGGGIRATIAGALDIGLSSRPLKDEERAKGAKQQAYAKSPFVLVTSGKSPNPALTSAQFIAFFGGGTLTWADGTPIRLILRPKDDSDTKILKAGFKGIEPALAKARATQGIPVASTDQQALDKAEALPGSLTTATLSAVIAEGRSLNPIAIDGVTPTVENLANGSYRHFKTLYLITGAGVSTLAQEFMDFIRSAEGARVLRETGNLPL